MEDRIICFVKFSEDNVPWTLVTYDQHKQFQVTCIHMMALYFPVAYKFSIFMG